MLLIAPLAACLDRRLAGDRSVGNWFLSRAEELSAQLLQGDPEENYEKCVDLKAVAGFPFVAGKEVRNRCDVGDVEKQKTDKQRGWLRKCLLANSLTK